MSKQQVFLFSFSFQSSIHILDANGLENYIQNQSKRWDKKGEGYDDDDFEELLAML